MTAYILQMLFLVLSLFSVVIMIAMILKRQNATKKQWWALLLPILFLFMTVAYRFDWDKNTSSDLYRFFQDFEAIGRYGLNYEMQYADNFASLWRVIAYVFSNVKDLHWFPVFATAVDFVIFFYILTETVQDRNLSALDVLICLVLRLSLMPLIMSISACRNSMAYSFFSLGVFMYYRHGLKDLRMYIWMLAGVLTHTSVFLGVVIFVLSLIVPKWKPALILLVLVGLFYGSVIGPMLENSTNEYIQYFVGKWDMYSTIPNKYDVQKTSFIILGLLSMFILMSCWYFGRRKSQSKNRVAYIIANIAVSIGVSGIMPTLFLRLCYPTAIAMPVLWGEIASTQWKDKKNGSFYLLVMIACVLMLFISTRLAWIYEIYWFFDV